MVMGPELLLASIAKGSKLCLEAWFSLPVPICLQHVKHTVYWQTVISNFIEKIKKPNRCHFDPPSLHTLHHKHLSMLASSPNFCFFFTPTIFQLRTLRFLEVFHYDNKTPKYDPIFGIRLVIEQSIGTTWEICAS